MHARSLDISANADFISITVKDGLCIGRHEHAPALQCTKDGYFHGVLQADRSGLVSFEPLPYRAEPYPSTDLLFTDAYEHVAEGKLWLIAKGSNGDAHVMYKNDVTDGRIVYQSVKAKPTILERIGEKLQKGYVKTKPMKFYPNTRRLTIT